jgi:hypothetical protein
MKRQNSSSLVNLVVALSCEARPLIQCFNLRQEKAIAGFRLYGNGDGINLIVSGAGKLATAAAVGFLAGRQGDDHTVGAAWLNVGIAGHGTMSVGEGVLIHKVTDQASGRVSYPPMVVNTPCPTSSVITVEHPETTYADDAAYDMEASVFVATAGRFVTSELVQIFKIISDNPQNPVESVTEKRISEWVENQLDTIRQLLEQLSDLATEYQRIHSLPPAFNELSALVRLSVSQRIQLESVCRRYYALGGSALMDSVNDQEIRSAKDLLLHLEALTAAL